jgi:hypothetical protein
MKISTHYTSTGRLVTIQADEELDLKSHGVFVDACRLAEQAEHSAIDVDLVRTRSIRGSGVAMLLMLRERTGWQRSRLRLLNRQRCHTSRGCNMPFEKTLDSLRMDAKFKCLHVLPSVFAILDCL